MARPSPLAAQMDRPQPLLRAGFVDIRQHDMAAFRGKPLRDFQAETLRRSGDHRNLPGGPPALRRSSWLPGGDMLQPPSFQ